MHWCVSVSVSMTRSMKCESVYQVQVLKIIDDVTGETGDWNCV